jgi:hypothetical protein
LSQQNFVCRRKAAVDQIKARNGWIRMGAPVSTVGVKKCIIIMRKVNTCLQKS